MLSVGYGGGTNMEWEGLTGLSISNLSRFVSYTLYPARERQKISPNITDLFDEKIAIHPFYSRYFIAENKCLINLVLTGSII